MTITTAAPETFPDYYCNLAGEGIFIDYCISPPRIPGRPSYVLSYESGHQTLDFERRQIRSTFVADLGWCLSVTTDELCDAGSVTATVLFPVVVMPTERGEIPVQTMLITTTHVIPALVTLPGQRDHYQLTELSGCAQKMRLY